MSCSKGLWIPLCNGYGMVITLLSALWVVGSLAQPATVIGRAGYALNFNAPEASQWNAAGPMITFSSETCTDVTGCVCCKSGRPVTECCNDASSLFKLAGAFTLEAWVNYRGIGHQSATGHIMGNLHYNWGQRLCTATSSSGSGCVAGSEHLYPLRGCSAECQGVKSGGFSLYCGDSSGGEEKGAHCGIAVARPDSLTPQGSIWILTSGLGSVSKNEWHHIAATYVEGELTLYIDALPARSHKFADRAGAVGSQTVAAFTIGGRNDPNNEIAQGAPRKDFGYGYFNGLLDELRIWSDVRNPGQVMIDMFDTHCGYIDATNNFLAARDQKGYCLQLDPLLVGYWPFDETPFYRNLSSNVLVRNVARPELGRNWGPFGMGEKWAGSVSWSPQVQVNGTSYMDRTVVGSMSASGAVTMRELAGGKLDRGICIRAPCKVFFTAGQTGTLKVKITDANVCVCVWVCVGVCIIYTYVYMYICIYVYTYMHI